MDYKHLSKTIAFALRHQPWVYELELDDEGWVAVESLLAALREERREWRSLEAGDLEMMIVGAEKQRYEIQDGRVRALYGHSATNSVRKVAAPPPTYLVHGTRADLVATILREGLKPMSRQYVHFSVDEETAISVAKRKSANIILLQILAQQAAQQGIAFYQGNSKVWLADFVPPQFIETWHDHPHS